MQSSQEVGNFSCVGEVNCKFIREFLENERIPLVSQDLGGSKGRVLHFSNGDFAVYVRKIDSTRSIRLAQRDHNCWLTTIEKQEKIIPDVDLWL
jgi:chemotaxis protein CheD